MEPRDAVVDWLMEGDPAIRWQVMRDLLARPPDGMEAERAKVATDGWGGQLVALQATDGRWGGGLYSPKWTSTFYTLLLLRDLGLPEHHPAGKRAAALLLERGFRPNDGGLNYAASWPRSETCISGMGLSMFARFGTAQESLAPLIQYVLREQMGDGGWNCQSPRGATHASFHTTISVLEGLTDYRRLHQDPDGLLDEAERRGREFLLAHELFRSHRTGEVVDAKMTRFAFPPRWHYDILRALDHFRDVNAARDPRLEPAIVIVRQRRLADGRWPLQNRYPGAVHFDMERPGKPSRWNTLRCLRVLKWWDALEARADELSTTDR